MTPFSQNYTLPFSATTVFDWHKQPGAFERLTPPWLDVRVIQRQGTIQKGLVTIEARLGLLKGRQQLEHYAYVAGKQFKDRQIKGPFAAWEHTHRFVELTENQMRMEDEIHYQFPKWLAFAQPWLDPFLKKELERLFNYRHTLLKQDLIRHQGVPPMKILITGASGLVGSALIPFLTAGRHQVFKLVRARANLLPNEIAWDPERRIINSQLLEGFDAVINLAGESIMGRWTEEKKKKILDSRVKGTRFLCQTLSQLQKPPPVLVNASAIGYYGSRGDEILTEQSAKGTGFLADVCEEWEKATQLAKDKKIRVVNIRIGMVLSPKGGALKQMLTPFKLGMGGDMGPGTQYISWIALDDLIGLIYYAIQQKELEGAVNAVTPYPVTNKSFTKTLGHVLKRPTFLGMPVFMIKLLFGEMGEELLLSSDRVIPEKLEQAGFRFGYPYLEEALRYLLGKTV